MKFSAPTIHLSSRGLVVLCLTIAVVLAGAASWQLLLLDQQQQQISDLKTQTNDAQQVALTQLKAQQAISEQLQSQLTAAQNDAEHQKYATLDSLTGQFQSIQDKVGRNGGVKLDTASVTNQYNDWGNKLLLKQYDELGKSFAAAIVTLDDQYASYQKSLVVVKATPKPQSNSGGSTSAPNGYSTPTVATSRGSFSVKLIKLALASYTVKTVTANSDNCANNCPAKSLASYVAENGAYAGIHGSYFCPPDYAACSGKTYSYDFPVYNTNLGKWLNQNALSWNSPGLATFNGHSATFYKSANLYSGGSVTAAIGNFPTLLVVNGSVAISDANLDSAQKNKGVRGALGVDGSNIYLAIISSASVLDAAYVMQSLGATQVLNLDGGGSQAMYIGGAYKAGPGRLLPNAIVLVAN